MLKNKILILGCAVIGAGMLSGCTSTKVTRVEVDEKIDLSGKWNDYDAMLVSEEMVSDCLNKPWVGRFADNQGKSPVVIVGHIVNRSAEHINAQVFVKYLEKELLNSGKVTFVASPVEREGVRAEREDMQKGNTSPETIKAIGKERGADFMLIGSINSVEDAVKGKSAVLYQVNLELINLTTNEKVWIGQKHIKKMVKRPRFSL